MLAAITVLGLLAALLFSTLQFGVRVWRAGDDGLARFSEIESSWMLMRRTLTTATTRLPPAELEGAETADFEGLNDAVRFIGASPAALLADGLYEMTFAVTGSGRERRLVFTALPADVGVATAPPAASAAVTLIEGVDDVRFAYFGRLDDNSAPSWYDRWVDQLALPDLISVRIAFAEGDRRIWPQLLVAPMLGLHAAE